MQEGVTAGEGLNLSDPVNRLYPVHASACRAAVTWLTIALAKR